MVFKATANIIFEFAIKIFEKKFEPASEEIRPRRLEKFDPGV
jgi:hypothetical protein